MSSDAAATVVALRERGAEQIDPVRFHFIEALARRAEALQGDARSLLDGRVAHLLSEYQARIEAPVIPRVASEPADALTALADLVRELIGPAAEVVCGAAPLAELKTLKSSRGTWAKLSVNRRLIPSIAKVPDQAGPLNSHFLALRSLELMRELSPEYLDRFMSYVDALLWLDRANGGAALVQKDIVRGEGEAKRKSSRKRGG